MSRERAAWHADAQVLRDAGWTLQDIGGQFGVTRERVRQVTAKRALRGCYGDPVAIIKALRNPTTQSMDDIHRLTGSTVADRLLAALGMKEAAHRLMRWRRQAPARRHYAAVIQAEAARLGRTPTLFELSDALGISRTQAAPTLIGTFGSVRAAMRYAGCEPRPAGGAGHVQQGPRAHCNKGHELTPENTYIHGAKQLRLCRTCSLERHRRYRTSLPSSRKAPLETPASASPSPLGGDRT